MLCTPPGSVPKDIHEFDLMQRILFGGGSDKETEAKKKAFQHSFGTSVSLHCSLLLCFTLVLISMY